MIRLIKILDEIFKMQKQDVERDFAPYFYTYFKTVFKDPSSYIENLSAATAHQSNLLKPRDKVILDVGCGFGLTAISLALSGARYVYSVDLNTEKIAVFNKILSRFEPPLNNIEARLGDATRLEFEDEAFDLVIGLDVISHVRDINLFLTEIARVTKVGGTLYIVDGNNSLVWHGRISRHKFWKKAEYGPIDTSEWRGTEMPLPYLLRRKEMIKQRYPTIEPKVLDLLAKETAGMYGDEISAAVRQYLENGSIPSKPAFKFRNPQTGEYPEAAINPLWLANRLRGLGFTSKFARRYRPIRPWPLKLSSAHIKRQVSVCIETLLPPYLSLFAIETFSILSTKQMRK